MILPEVIKLATQEGSEVKVAGMGDVDAAGTDNPELLVGGRKSGGGGRGYRERQRSSGRGNFKVRGHKRKKGETVGPHERGRKINH